MFGFIFCWFFNFFFWNSFIFILPFEEFGRCFGLFWGVVLILDFVVFFFSGLKLEQLSATVDVVACKQLPLPLLLVLLARRIYKNYNVHLHVLLELVDQQVLHELVQQQVLLELVDGQVLLELAQVYCLNAYIKHCLNMFIYMYCLNLLIFWSKNNFKKLATCWSTSTRGVEFDFPLTFFL